MKLYARLENEKGKVDGIGGDNYIDLQLTYKNTVVASIRFRTVGANAWEWYAEKKQGNDWNRIVLEQSENLAR